MGGGGRGDLGSVRVSIRRQGGKKTVHKEGEENGERRKCNCWGFIFFPRYIEPYKIFTTIKIE